MEHFHIIEVFFLGPTNHRGARMKIKSHRFSDSVVLPCDYESRDTLEQAVKYLQNRGFNLVGTGETKETYIIVSDTFKGVKE